MTPLPVFDTRGKDRETAAGALMLPADTTPVAGDWRSCDAATRGLARVVVTNGGAGLTLRVFGAGKSGLHDWGDVPARAFPLAGAEREACALFARYELAHARVLLAGYLNKGLLVIDAFTTFTDESGRADYVARDHFYRLV